MALKKTAAPTQIKLQRSEGLLTLSYGEQSHSLSCEYLRVHSPSAEVRGHGPGQEVLQIGKKNVKITRLEPMGHYALRLVFDDGHDSGIYTWDYLKDLCLNEQKYWQQYLDSLQQTGQHRDPSVQVVQLLDPKQ